ncbi:MAG: PKD domain-containing protein, partial [Flavobacteriales bacterium]|nr:PKD domain-containing protein [Flavobacteriales bacterium]
GCTATATTSATINPLPTPTAGNNGPVCQGTTLNLTASGGTSYSWTGPNGFTNTTQNPSITNASVAASGVYTVTVTSAAGCTATATTSATINPLPTPTAGNSGPVCQGTTLYLTASGGTSYSWTGPNGFTNASQNPSITNASVAASGVYTVTVTSAAGCTATATTSATINPLPTPTAGNNGPICTGATLNLNATGGNGYDWTGPNGFTSNIQNPSISNVPLLASGIYTVTVTSAAGCTATATTNVTIHPLPIAIANNDGPVCEGNTFNITAGGGVSYSWTGPASYTSTQQNNSINNAQPNQGGTYIVIVTDNNGCSNTASTTVVVHALPIATASAGGPACEGLNISLSASGGTNYQWTGPNAFSSTSQSPVISGATTSNNGTYTVTVTDANGCSSTASTTITVYAIPIASFTAANLSGCSPVCTDFTDLSSVNGSTITNWSWSSNGTNFSNQQNPTQCFTNTGLYDISLTVTSAQGCSATIVLNDFIQVFPNPVADFFINPDLIPSGNPVAQFINASSGNITSWNWDFGDGNTSTLENPNHNYSDTGVYCVTLTVITANGCQANAQNCLYVYPEFVIYIPNTFTPNDDKINDFFSVEGQGIKSIQMFIYNRWGEPIYSTDNLQGWPGFIRNTSEIAKQDVYVYKIYVTDILDGKHEYHGHVNLLR